MLASNKGMGRSMASTRSSQSTKNNRKEGFVAYIFNRMMAWVSYFYSKSKSFLWVGSTGFILLILPFSFAYIMEYQKEAQKIMGESGGL